MGQATCAMRLHCCVLDENASFVVSARPHTTSKLIKEIVDCIAREPGGFPTLLGG